MCRKVEQAYPEGSDRQTAPLEEQTKLNATKQSEAELYEKLVIASGISARFGASSTSEAHLSVSWHSPRSCGK